MLSKPLIQFSVDGGSRVPSLVFGLRPNYGRGNGIMETSFKRTYDSTPCSFQDYCIQCPNPVADHLQPMPLPETPGHSQASLAQSFERSLLLSPGSCCTQGFVCAL